MIRFERVTYTYPFQTCPAVSDISFSVRPGELVLCTGASGCGKSTLMRLANGLCPHYFQGTLEGRVLIGGEPTDARPINAIAREVGTLFQDPEQQFFALNVEDELAFAHEWQGVSPEAIAAKIDEAARSCPPPSTNCPRGRSRRSGWPPSSRRGRGPLSLMSRAPISIPKLPRIWPASSPNSRRGAWRSLWWIIGCTGWKA